MIHRLSSSFVVKADIQLEIVERVSNARRSVQAIVGRDTHPSIDVFDVSTLTAILFFLYDGSDSGHITVISVYLVLTRLFEVVLSVLSPYPSCSGRYTPLPEQIEHIDRGVSVF